MSAFKFGCGGKEEERSSPQPQKDQFRFGKVGGEKCQLEESLEKEIVEFTNVKDSNASCFSSPTDNKLTRSISVLSEESACSVTSEDLDEPTVYTHAPYEVFGEADEIGRVRVAKDGEKLPLEKWKQKKGFAVKFSVSATLKVSVIKKRDLAEQSISSESFLSPLVSSTPRKRPSSSFFLEESLFHTEKSPSPSELSKEVIDALADEENQGTGKFSSKQTLLEVGKFSSKQEWLSDLNQDFEDIVVGGLEVGLRGQVEDNIKMKVKMTPKQNMALIHSINHHIYKFIGKQRPDSSLCRDIAALFKKFIPETFAVSDSILTDFGPLPVKKSKGEGGLESLAERIASNFYNRYVRMDIKKPEMLSGSGIVDFTVKKNPRKFYGISPEKWNLASKLTQEEFERSAAFFSNIEELEYEDKLEVLSKARNFLQINFRKEDPSSHLIKLSSFWKMPHGPKLLSDWFEWLVDGSKDGDLVKSIEDHIDPILRMVEKFLENKKGDDWAKKVEEVENNCTVNYGNTLLFQIFLIRELAKSWGNKGEKLIFIEGKDDIKNMSNQPFFHAVKLNRPGENDYEDAVVFSVRVGSSLVFDDVSLTQGLASVIHLSFVFNLLYPTDCDDLFNFTQRILCNFGPADGARNPKGQLKRNFVDFQVALGSYMLTEKKAEIKQLFI